MSCCVTFWWGLARGGWRTLKAMSWVCPPFPPSIKQLLGFDKMDLMMGVPLSIKKSHNQDLGVLVHPLQCMGDLLCPHFIEYDSFHKYLCVKVGGLVLVAEAGKIFLTRAFLEEIFAVSNFDALGSWGKHLCWAGEKCNIEAALLNVETIWSWKK